MLLVGKVIRPHGLEGLLRIKSFAGSISTFLDAGPVFIRSTSGRTDERAVLSIRSHKNIFLMKLEGLDSQVEAEKYRRAEIYLRKDALATEHDKDEYYWHELLGLSAYLDTGIYLGVISQIIPTGSNDIYAVTDGNRETLLPATHEVIKEVDLERGMMIVSPLEGLLDLNEI